jgi:hypothetical protein
MSQDRVEVTTPRGRTAVGQVVDRLAEGDVRTGPQSILVVDVCGSRFRVPEADATPV